MTLRQNITMDDVVGTKVLIHLHREAFELLRAVQGIDNQKFVAHVVGLDGFGLWIENPQYTVVPVYDDNGKYIPPEERKEMTHRAAFLLQFGAIQTLIQFPERESFTGSEDEVEIGFKAMANRQEEKQDG